MIGYNHHRHHHHHHHHNTHAHTHTVYQEPEWGFSFPPGWQVSGRRRAKSQHFQGEGKRRRSNHRHVKQTPAAQVEKQGLSDREKELFLSGSTLSAHGYLTRRELKGESCHFVSECRDNALMSSNKVEQSSESADTIGHFQLQSAATRRHLCTLVWKC